jgi:hypothetical protein
MGPLTRGPKTMLHVSGGAGIPFLQVRKEHRQE